jgi:cysteine desulfurase
MGTSVLEALTHVSESAVRVIDAVQLAPWRSLASLNDERTFYVLSGAKLGAPLGVGALRVPSKSFYTARQSGEPLESESPPWLMAIGLGAACEARASRREELLKIASARSEELLAGLRDVAPDLVVNGSPEARLGPILNVSFPDQYGKSLVAALSLEGVCISHTAACQARRSEVSPVVRAAYPREPARAVGATRWSVSERVTSEEIAFAVQAAKRLVAPRKRAE